MKFLFVLIIVLFVLVCSGIRIVPQSYCYVIERFGQYNATWQAGFHWLCPIIDRIVRVVDMKEQVADISETMMITRDNARLGVDSIIYYKVFNPEDFVYKISNPEVALSNLTTTTLRSVFGSMDLDETLSNREAINGKLQGTLDRATDPWGIKVIRVELQNINPPESIQIAMEKQMRAEREKREKILHSEGEKQSLVLVAQGKNEAMILEAEAKKAAAIAEAEGEAEAIRLVQEATAAGLRMLSEVNISDETVKIKALEAFALAANGQATKIIIPSEIQGIAGLAGGVVEAVKEGQ